MKKVMVDAIELFPIPGREGYAVSKCGKVRSLRKVITRSDGKTQTIRARWLKTSVHRGYHHVDIVPPMGNRKVHRIMGLTFLGVTDPDQEVDHINGVRSDNRLDNLRVATNAQNKRNAALRRDSTSGRKGVSWHKRDRRWVASIRKDNVLHRLGRFKDLDEAAKAYDEASVRLHGKFSKNNESLLSSGFFVR